MTSQNDSHNTNSSHLRQHGIRHRLMRLAVYIALLLLAFFFILPFYTMIVASFMERDALFSVKPLIFPDPFIIENYVNLFAGELGSTTINTPFVQALINSFLLATGQTIPALFFTSLVAFVFAKCSFPGRKALFIFVLITMMLPYQSTIVPFFLLMSRLGWVNTFLPLWVPWWAPAFGIFLMYQSITATVPDELIEAAKLDGASLFGIYWRVVLPVITPMLTVFGILAFMNAWNDYIYSNIIFTDPTMLTIPLFLALFKGTMSQTAPEYGIMSAGSVLATIPLLIIFFAFQRWLVSGLMSGAIKS